VKLDYHKRKRGQRTFKESRALYPIAAQFKIGSLKSILDVYDLRREQPDLTLWEIGQKLSLTTTLTQAELSAGRGRADATAVEKKNVLTAIDPYCKQPTNRHIGQSPMFTQQHPTARAILALINFVLCELAASCQLRYQRSFPV
jgi:hypothetical protein